MALGYLLSLLQLLAGVLYPWGKVSASASLSLLCGGKIHNVWSMNDFCMLCGHGTWAADHIL